MTIARQASLLGTLYTRIYSVCRLRHVRDEEDGENLTSHQAAILENLDETIPTTLRELASRMGVTASTMSLNVSRLVGAGYVVRTGIRAIAGGSRCD